jgi:hypothetical protein
MTFTSGINKDRPPVPGGAVAAAIAGSFGYFARDLSLELACRKGRQSAWGVRAGFRFLLGVQAHRADTSSASRSHARCFDASR